MPKWLRTWLVKESLEDVWSPEWQGAQKPALTSWEERVAVNRKASPSLVSLVQAALLYNPGQHGRAAGNLEQER